MQHTHPVNSLFTIFVLSIKFPTHYYYDETTSNSRLTNTFLSSVRAYRTK